MTWQIAVTGVLTIVMFVLGWLLTRAFRASDMALAKANSAKETVQVVDQQLQDHIQHDQQRFEQFEKHADERHHAIMSAITDLKKDVRSLRNGKLN